MSLMNRNAINIMSPKFWADCRLIYEGCMSVISVLGHVKSCFGPVRVHIIHTTTH